jgi:hypothetical protein
MVWESLAAGPDASRIWKDWLNRAPAMSSAFLESDPEPKE